jgi:catechol 2,3-dioxygenase-like lactoylglutathione lyase family enzyme
MSGHSAADASRCIAGLRQVSLPVTDVERAVAFYGDVVGLGHIATFGDLAFFDLDGVRLLLERSDAVEPSEGMVLYLAVDDVHVARDALAGRGVQFVDEPHAIFTDTAGTFGTAGEAEWMVFFRDPDGHLLALSSREPPP